MAQNLNPKTQNSSRNYDAQIGRWLQPDPLMQHPSPYLAMSNNPVSFTDPLGLEDEWFGIDSRGNIVGYGQGFGDRRFALLARNGNGNFDSEEISESGFYFYLSAGINRRLQYAGLGQVLDINGNHREAGYAYGARAANYRNNQLAWGMNLKEAQGMNAKGSWDNSSLALDIGGGIYGGLQGLTSSQGYWLGKNGKYYSNSWGGNQYTGGRSGAFKAASNYKLAGKATVIGSALIGVYNTRVGYQRDGGQFGYNAQMAAASSAGSIVGGIAGAEAGALIGSGIGALFGGVGAIPGAVIGGVIGGFGFGMAGGYYGGQLGGNAVNYYHGR